MWQNYQKTHTCGVGVCGVKSYCAQSVRVCQNWLHTNTLLCIPPLRLKGMQEREKELDWIGGFILQLKGQVSFSQIGMQERDGAKELFILSGLPVVLSL